MLKQTETAAQAKKAERNLPENIREIGGRLMTKMALGGAACLRAGAEEVNRLNVFPVPDGDTGDNMRMTIESGIAAIEKLDSDDIAEVMKALSHGMLLGARGNSGVILSQFFDGTAKGFANASSADPTALGHALTRGVKQAYGSVVTPTEGTILTVAREAVEYAVARITPDSSIRSFFGDLVKEMRASLSRTPEILSVLKEAGVVDSGGAGLLYIMDGFNRVLNGEEIDGGDISVTAPAVGTATAAIAFDADSEMRYGYCTELLLALTRAKGDPACFDIDGLKRFLTEIGDSIVAFRTEDIVKVHVHTFTPDKVLAYCLAFGEFLTVKIENMSVQHTATVSGEGAPTDEKPQAPKKKYGIVAVSSGAGISALFKELGADAIVEGGQTQNPSTSDFLAAFDTVAAEHIFVLPNNGNIVMAAQQAADLYTDAAVHVIGAKSIGTGYAALSYADIDADGADGVIASMTEAITRVTAGYISPSIRDAEIGGVHIENGDTIGVIGGEIVVSERERAVAAGKLAEMLLAPPDKFVLSVFCGKDATEDDRAMLFAHIGEHCPDAEVYFIDGGQEVYPFLFVAE